MGIDSATSANDRVMAPEPIGLHPILEPDALFIDQVIGQVKAVGAPELLFGPGTYYYSIGIIRTILTVAPASKLSPYPDIGPPVEARPKAARQRHTHGQRRARGLLGSRRSRGVGRGTSCRGSTSNGSILSRFTQIKYTYYLFPTPPLIYQDEAIYPPGGLFYEVGGNKKCCSSMSLFHAT